MSGSSSSSLPTARIDRTLHALGFEYTLISPGKVAGRLKVTKTCCQPFDVLNGGVSALMAESTASLGAYVASRFRRVAGVQLSTNHIKAAMLGEEVEVEARPVQVGNTIQVWEVETRKIDPSSSGRKVLVSTSKVTLLCNRQAPTAFDDYQKTIKKAFGDPPPGRCNHTLCGCSNLIEDKIALVRRMDESKLALSKSVFT